MEPDWKTVTVLKRLLINTKGVNLGFTLPAAVQRLAQQLRQQLQPGHTSREELGNRGGDWLHHFRSGAGSGLPPPGHTAL